MDYSVDYEEETDSDSTEILDWEDEMECNDCQTADIMNDSVGPTWDPKDSSLLEGLADNPTYILPYEGLATKLMNNLPLRGLATKSMDNLPLRRLASNTMDNLPSRGLATKSMDNLPLSRLASNTMDNLPSRTLATKSMDNLPLRRLASNTMNNLPSRELPTKPFFNFPLKRLAISLMDNLPLRGLATKFAVSSPLKGLAANTMHSSLLNRPATKPSSPLNGLTANNMNSAPLEGLETHPLDSCPLEGLATEPMSSCPLEGLETRPLDSCPSEGLGTEPLDSFPVEGLAREPMDSCPVEGLATEPLDSCPVEGLAREPMDSCPSEGLATEPMDSCSLEESAVDNIVSETCFQRPTKFGIRACSVFLDNLLSKPSSRENISATSLCCSQENFLKKQEHSSEGARAKNLEMKLCRVYLKDCRKEKIDELLLKLQESCHQQIKLDLSTNMSQKISAEVSPRGKLNEFSLRPKPTKRQMFQIGQMTSNTTNVTNKAHGYHEAAKEFADRERTTDSALQSNSDETTYRCAQNPAAANGDEQEDTYSDEEGTRKRKRGSHSNRYMRSNEKDHIESAVEYVRKNKKKIEDICISCDNASAKVVSPHPLFIGGLCDSCRDDISGTLFTLAEDGTSVYCVICGYGGEMFLCRNKDCGRGYCLECIKTYLSEDHVTQIRQIQEWLCFLCSPWSEGSHGYLKPRQDWNCHEIHFYNRGSRLKQPDISHLIGCNKRPIRVLSLFDGIGTGKFVLDELGIQIDKYYSSEIDADALIVTRYHYGNQVINVGDIRDLNEQKLHAISPIDLVIGGSPCNEFSIANPGRRGLEFGGTGTLFFHFYRVLKSIQNLNGDRHVFWLYENVSSMQKHVKEEMSLFFECNPALWDCVYFMPQKRARYFWGNIPGIFSTPDLNDRFSADSHNLNEVLSTHCNRKAAFQRLRTVTRSSNSLTSGKNETILPVYMDGKNVQIWTTELEAVFGFPRHYTDVANLDTTRRQRLLGNAWAVPVVKHILRPLTKYFATKHKNK